MWEHREGRADTPSQALFEAVAHRSPKRSDRGNSRKRLFLVLSFGGCLAVAIVAILSWGPPRTALSSALWREGSGTKAYTGKGWPFFSNKGNFGSYQYGLKEWPLVSRDESWLGKEAFPRVGVYGDVPQMDADLINGREDPQQVSCRD